MIPELTLNLGRKLSDHAQISLQSNLRLADPRAGIFRSPSEFLLGTIPVATLGGGGCVARPSEPPGESRDSWKATALE
jgi:hypothetical protein